MYIERNGKKFELTAEELENAYYEHRLMLQRDDAEKALADFAGVDPEFELTGPSGATFEGFYAEELNDFKCNFGFSYADVIDKNSRFYAIDKIIESYNDNYSSENAPKDAWHWACKDVLCDLAHALKVPVRYLLTDDYNVDRLIVDANNLSVEDAEKMFLDKFGYNPDVVKTIDGLGGTIKVVKGMGRLLYNSVKSLNAHQDVKDYIDMGVDVNYRFMPDEFDFRPLHIAAYNGDIKKIQMLVQAGCDINPLDIDGNTPLDLAIRRHNYPAVIDYLVANGAQRGDDLKKDVDGLLKNASERSIETENSQDNIEKDIIK